MYLQAIGDSGQGIANGLLFGLFTEKVFSFIYVYLFIFFYFVLLLCFVLHCFKMMNRFDRTTTS